MRKAAVQNILDRLREHQNMRGAALFGVISGKLSEGVDYSNNILNSIVCVGLPMPPPSARQDALMGYYTNKFDRNTRLLQHYECSSLSAELRDKEPFACPAWTCTLGCQKVHLARTEMCQTDFWQA